MTISSDIIGEVKSFKYLGSFVQKDGGFDEDVKYRVKFGWIDLREASGTLSDKRIPTKLKGKFYKTVLKCGETEYVI